VKTLSAILIFCCSILVSAQVKITVPQQRYSSGDKIGVTITNTGATEITYCVSYKNFAFVDHHIQQTFPSPLSVQERGSQGWATLITGYDDSLPPPQPVTLRLGEAQHFPFRVHTHGPARLVLEYTLGSNEHFCEDRKNMRVVGTRSREFPID
jgi:hypothetical protein